MRIESLGAFGIHRDLLATWESHYSAELLPAQAAAVREGGVLNGSSVVLYAPTGAGKTFVGEMAAMRAATAGQRAVYLVPTKALAEEKYSHWARLYASLGLRIIISTRDRRGGDGSLVRGDFDMAICVPEKLRFLLSQSPGTARHIGCMVVDELQAIGDPVRGLCLEVVLAQILTRARNVQIVGLSAVIDRPQSLADWLGATPVCVHERPIELRKGVLAEGVFRYQEHNSGQSGEEQLEAGGDEAGFAQAVAELACWFAQRREPTLVFLRDKPSTVRLAHRLSEAADLPSAEESLERLRSLPATSAHDQLAELLGRGVAFHNADLQFAEREIVEEAFARGEIRLLCSTSTLAMGVNLPAKNVIIDPLRWEDVWGTQRPALAPISRADFENMGGRAGRLHLSDEFGRAILLADTEFTQAALFDRYVRKPFEPVTPALLQQPPLLQLLALCATGDQATEADLARVYGRTFAAHQQGVTSEERLPAPLQAVAQEAVDCGLLHHSSITSALTVTPEGRLCSASGLSLSGFKWLRHWVAVSAGEVLPDLTALLIAAATPEARALRFPLQLTDLDKWDFVAELRNQVVERSEKCDVLEQVMASGELGPYQRAQAIKLALALLEWASSQPTCDVEEATRVPAGRLQLCADTVGWLLQVMAQIGRQVGWSQSGCARLSRWADRIAAGLPAQAVNLYRGAHGLLSRDHILDLLAAGVCSWGDALALPPERRAKLLPDIDLGQTFGPTQATPRPATRLQPRRSDPVLLIDEGRPDQVVFRDSEVYLRPAEHKLLRLLASQPRRCVSYDTIYNELWGPDEVVESAQVHWHRYHLAEKLRAVADGGDEDTVPIKTIPRRGYMLDLPPEQVEIR